MRYGYECESCGLLKETDFPMGKAPRHIKCICGDTALRIYNVAVHVPTPVSEARKNRGKG